MPIHEHMNHPHPHNPKNDGFLGMKILKSSMVTSCIAGAMFLGGIPITTILPTSAPIWMGFATLFSSK